MTPSRDINSSTLIFLMTELLSTSGTPLASLAFGCSCENLRWYAKFAHFHRRPAGDHRLTSPRQRLVQVSDLEHPETADVFLGLQVGTVGGDHLAVGLRPQRLGLADGVEAAEENHDTGSRHLFVERVDSADSCFALVGRLETVGVMNRN